MNAEKINRVGKRIIRTLLAILALVWIVAIAALVLRDSKEYHNGSIEGGQGIQQSYASTTQQRNWNISTADIKV